MSKVLTLDYENDHEYTLIGIHATLEDYRLAFKLNSALNIHLERAPEDLDFGKSQVRFSLYTYDCNTTFSSWALIANKYAFKNDTHQMGDYLFKENYEVGVLIKEQNKVDYFLKIDSEFDAVQLENILSEINKMGNVITSYLVDPQTLKSKDYLIF